MLEVKVNDKQNYVIAKQDDQWTIDGNNVAIESYFAPNKIISVLYNNNSCEAVIEKIDIENKEVTVRVNGQVYKCAIKEPIDQLLASMGLDLSSMKKAEPVKAPMPGLILKILVTPGQQINKGDGLLILEAMKMENVLKATASATVKDIRVQERTAVEKGAILIDLE